MADFGFAKYTLIACAAIFCPVTVLAASADEDLLHNYVDQLKSQDASVFVARCKVAGDVAEMIFKVGDAVGRYAMIGRSTHGDKLPLTAAFGAVSAEHGYAKPVAATGGLASEPAQEEMMGYLMTLPFKFITHEHLNDLYSLSGMPACSVKGYH